MTTAAQIAAALAKLDISNDNHWTADGLARLETVRMLAGDQSLTREAVTAAVPGHSRASAYAAAQAAPSATPDPAANAAQGTPAAATTPETGDMAADDTDTGLPPVLAPEGKAAEPAFDFAQTDELHAAQEQLDILRKAKIEADAAYNAQVAVVDALIVTLEKSRQAQQSTPAAIQQYLASRRENLQARGEHLTRVRSFEKEIGAKLADLLPKRSPLDNAMSRKNTRGANRPTR